MRHLFDVTEQLTNGIDVKVHATRGQDWCEDMKCKHKERKETAAAMLRNDKPNNTFVIAKVCKLPVMVVRDLEAEYLEELKRKGAEA